MIIESYTIEIAGKPITYSRETFGNSSLERLEEGAATIYDASGAIDWKSELTEKYVIDFYVSVLLGRIQVLEERIEELEQF